MNEENNNQNNEIIDVQKIVNTKKMGRPRKYIFPSKLVCTYSGKIVSTNPKHFQRMLKKENKNVNDLIETFLCGEVRKRIRHGELMIDKETGKVVPTKPVELPEPKRIGLDIDINNPKPIRPPVMPINNNDINNHIIDDDLNDEIVIPEDKTSNETITTVETDDDKITSIEVPDEPESFEDVWRKACSDDDESKD